MMTRLYIALIVVSISGAGLAYLIVMRNRLQDRTGRAAIFLQYFHEFLRTRSVSSENYSWLLRHSYEMQADMGAFGVMGHFRPAYERYMIPNWPIVLNSIPEMRRCLAMEFSTGVGFDEYGAMLQEAILRYAGALEAQASDMDRLLRNPIAWFRHGIQLLLIPFMILRSLGLRTVPEQGVLQKNPLFGLLTTVAAIAAFFSSVVTVAAGWDTVSSVGKALIGHLFK